MVEVAAAAGVGMETLRKIETGRVPTPAFFTVAAIAAELGVDPGLLAHRAAASGNGQSDSLARSFTGGALV
jgi:transcriptional regulator with XRE-family HTH domain